MRKFCVFLRKNKGLGRWPFLDNGPAKIHKRVTTPTASVIIKITVLSTSNTKSRSPQTVREAAPSDLGNLSSELGKAHVQITLTIPRDHVRKERAER